MTLVWRPDVSGPDGSRTSPPMPESIRPMRDAERSAVAQLFTDAVHGLAVGHYDAAQRDAWAPRIPDLAQWRERLRGRTVLVAAAEPDGLRGFIAYEDDGHIDMLFVAPAAARSGVATRLCACAEAALVAAGVSVLSTEASLVARPFFAQRGFAVVAEEHAERAGVTLRRFAMRKILE